MPKNTSIGQKKNGKILPWTDESKIILFVGTGSRQYVRCPPNTEYKAQNTQNYKVKHGGAKLMIWGSFLCNGVD